MQLSSGKSQITNMIREANHISNKTNVLYDSVCKQLRRVLQGVCDTKQDKNYPIIYIDVATSINVRKVLKYFF